MSKLVVVIQCDHVCHKCSGYPCANAFYNKEGAFAEYPHGTRYMSMTCGGCCGIEVASKLEDLRRKFKRYGQDIDDVVVHLAACIVSDNYHNPPCPHREYIKEIVTRKGFELKLGSYISKTATKRREEGLYKDFTE